MPENTSGTNITIPDPLNINKKYDYNLFVIECAKQLFASNYFGNIEGQEQIDEAQFAKDAIRRAQILANELFVNEYLTDATSIAEKSPSKNKNAETENPPKKTFNPEEAIKLIKEKMEKKKSVQ